MEREEKSNPRKNVDIWGGMPMPRHYGLDEKLNSLIHDDKC